MKKYLSLLKNSKLFQGISEDELTSMLGLPVRSYTELS